MGPASSLSPEQYGSADTTAVSERSRDCEEIAPWAVATASDLILSREAQLGGATGGGRVEGDCAGGSSSGEGIKYVGFLVVGRVDSVGAVTIGRKGDLASAGVALAGHRAVDPLTELTQRQKRRAGATRGVTTSAHGQRSKLPRSVARRKRGLPHTLTGRTSGTREGAAFGAGGCCGGEVG